MKGGPVVYAIATALFYTALGAGTFRLAGSWTLPFFWAVFASYLIVGILGSILIDPDLIAERIRPPKGQDRDPLGVLLLGTMWFAQLAIAARDVGHWHVSATVPVFVQVVAVIIMSMAWLAVMWSMMTNKFFSSAIRLQTDRGQHVVATGPYAYMRHPGYAFSSIGLIAEGIALGSWLSTIPAIVMVFHLLYRTMLEETLLTKELAGYKEYAEQVPYKWIPKVW